MTQLTHLNQGERRSWLVCLVGLIVIGVVRIVLSYPAVSQTIDEGSHVATGIEWLDQGNFTLNQENPPLARIAVALGPYFSGAVSGDSLEERVHVLSGDTAYPRTLYLARLGALPFFIAATLVVFIWGSVGFDRSTGLFGAAIFTMLPPVLGHAGLATTDVAAAASTAGAILALVLWMDRPTKARMVLLALTVGIACLCKFTAILFLGASGVAFVVAQSALTRDLLYFVRVVQKSFFPLVWSFAIAAFVVWAGYRFSVGSVRHESDRPYRAVDHIVGDSGWFHDLAYRVIEAPIVPAPELFGGIGQTIAHHREPHTTYLLGETREHGGFWSFFPIAYLVKTPIPFTLLVMIGSIASVGMAWRERKWTHLAPLVSALAIMLAAMPSGVNVGLRHILAIFPMLSLVAAVGILCVVRSNEWRRQSIRWATLGLCAWLLMTSLLCHPDYLPYFNMLAGRHPEKILADSDLDWGQDVGRLSEELHNRGIDQVQLGLFTTANLDHFDWPKGTSNLQPGVPVTGWVAASIFHIKVSKDFAWLEAHEPVDTIGNSIRLYFISATPHEQVLGTRLN